jgi:hydroxymethylglutaryl-CoA lyase
MSDLPSTVRIMEVGPRDGLQIEPKVLDVADKLKLIDALMAAKIAEIEVGSFVNPKAVPQMASTAEVVAALPEPASGMRFRALWLNARGLDQAIASGRVHVDGKLTLTASETFSRRNTNRGIEETLAQIPDWIARYRVAGIEPNTLGLMTVFGCNYEGEIPQERVLRLIKRTVQILADHDAQLRHVSLADTMGWANPLQIKRMIAALRERWPKMDIKLHLHDTRGAAIANAVAAIELGVAEFDAAIGGLGGCPFAGHKGAAGNVCTEDLAFVCEEMGIATGVNIPALIEAARLAEALVEHQLPGKLMKGGLLNRPGRGWCP